MKKTFLLAISILFFSQLSLAQRHSMGGISRGSLCGLDTYNIHNGWAASIECGQSAPSRHCPRGFQQVSTITNGGLNTIYSCASLYEETEAPRGSLCGLVSYNLNNGWSLGEFCRGMNPSERCPNGFRKSETVINGGVDRIYSCTAIRSIAKTAGMLCGLTNQNIHNGITEMVSCGRRNGPRECPVGYSPRMTLTHGGVDRAHFCAADGPKSISDEGFDRRF